MSGVVGWNQAFDDPIPMPVRRPLFTLRDAARDAELTFSERTGAMCSRAPSNIHLPWAGHGFCAIPFQKGTSMKVSIQAHHAPAKARASTIIDEFEKAESQLSDKAVILTGGKAGTVEKVWLDELHGL
jgi:hypothetical protein